MSTLVWGVKSSLLGYVRGMPDGRIETDRGASETVEGFVFPGDELRFTGSLTLTGHGGMMRVVLADPALIAHRDGWLIEISDADAPSGRAAFATVASFDGERGTGVALTADGADLFFGPYVAGTAFDDLIVRA